MEKENQLERDMRDRGRKGGQKKTWREGEKIANLRRKEMTERRKKKKEQRSSNGKVPVMKTEEKTKKKKSLQG